MADEYLLKEYELCFEQLRYYDDRHSSLLKFLFGLTSAVATAQFAVYKFEQGATTGFFACQVFLSFVVFVATLLLYLGMLQNRLYFVYIARQINAIRGYMMATAAGDFHGNQLYTSTNFPAFKPSSIHTLQLIGASLISSLFAGLSAYAICPALGDRPCILAASVTFVLVLLAEIAGGIIYLSRAGAKTADQAIHGQKPNQTPARPGNSPSNAQ